MDDHDIVPVEIGIKCVGKLLDLIFEFIVERGNGPFKSHFILR